MTSDRPTPPESFAIRSILLALGLLAGAILSVEAIDFNRDGMSDVWEALYGVEGPAADQDSDADGLTNRQESLLGTNPRDSLSAFYLVPQPGDEAGTLKLRIDTAFGKLYQVESSGDFSHWSPLGSPITGTGSVVEVTVDPGPSASAMLYRGRFAGDIDQDNDGLTAWEENLLGTSDINPDSDGDGMPDGWEYGYHLDPLTDDAAGDADGDGASNLQEYQGGTDPNDPSPAVALQLMPGNISIVLNRGETSDNVLSLVNASGVVSTFQLTPHNNLTNTPAFTDSDQPSGPAYIWEDIKATGTIIQGISQADDAVERVDLAFPFPFFGETFTSAFVCSNGFISFTEESSQFDNYPLPSGDMPANEIAGFHVDLSTALSGAVYYRNDPDRTIIQFDDVSRIDHKGHIDFQIILHRDGAIDLEYKNVPTVVNDATIGVQDGTRSNGLTVSFGQNYLHANMAVRITSASEWFSVSPATGHVGPGESQPVTISFNAQNLPSGTYAGELSLARDASTPALQSLPVTLAINHPPQVTITSPSDNAECLENVPVVISADATDEDGTVARVQFFADGQFIGEATSAPYTSLWPQPPAGAHVLTAQAVDDHNATTLSGERHVIALANSDNDGLPDAWELEHFGNLEQTGDDDFDHDGLTNEQEYHNGTDPVDYYNGVLPLIVKVAGDNQHGEGGSTLPQPAIVRVTDQQDTPLANAPVSFRITSGDGAIAVDGQGATSSAQVRTNAAGEASIFLIAPETRGSHSSVSAEVHVADQIAAVTFSTRANTFLVIAPDSLSFAVNLPAAQSQSIFLQNNGPTTLDFNCEADALAYRFADSTSADGPAYQWTDISTTGTLLAVVSQSDDYYEAVDLPFSFPFFGNTYSTIYVSSNGYLTVGAGSGSATPGSFPGSVAVPGEIAAFHTDLNPSAGGHIFCLKTADHIIIQFDQVPHYDGSGLVTFQIILDQAGAITFQYKSMRGILNAAAVGLQNLTQDEGVEVAFNKAYVANDLAVRFTRDVSWLSATPATGQIEPGQSAEITVIADASTLIDSNYSSLVHVQSVADQSDQEIPVVLAANAPPEVEIASPAQGVGVVPGETVTVEAFAQDRRSEVAQVEFYEGSNLIGTKSEPPFTVNWQVPGDGSFVLTARATDSQGATATSSPRLLQVQADSDGDGLGDQWEMANFGNLDQEALGDFDGDGRSNLQEFQAGSAGSDFYDGKVPYPSLRTRSRGAGKRKVGLRPYINVTPPAYYLQSEMIIDLISGNPESPVHGTIQTTVDPDTGAQTVTATGNAPPPYYGSMDWDPAPTATQRVDHLTIFFGAEADGGAYDDPPNLVDDLEAVAEETTILSAPYTTDLLIARTRDALPPIPPFDAPFTVADDVTFADFEFLPGNQQGVYITHSNYQFKWQPSPNLPEHKSVDWTEIFYPLDDQRTPGPEDGTPIKTARHWEGTGNESDIFYLTPDRPGRYLIQVLDGELLVDGNRDGQMSISDGAIHNADLTSSARAYRFWINDDDDTELAYGDGGEPHPAETEKVPPAQPDCGKHQIVSKRNLEDFSRLWINVSGIAYEVQAGDIQIGLKWKTVESGAPAINIYQSEDENGSTKYLTDEAAAARQIDGLYNLALTDQFNRQTIEPNHVFVFKREYWNGTSSDFPLKCLLFEGAQEGKGELAIVFFDRSGVELATGGSVWLDLKQVRRLYERAKITLDAPQIPDPWDNDNPEPLQWSWDPWNWPPEVDPNADNTTIIFVHGWRMTYDEYIGWADTTFKRMYQLGYKGRFYSFNWPTFNGDNNGTNPLDLYEPGGTSYNPSEYRAWLSGPALASFINQLPNPDSRYLFAHSMGNVTVGSALRSGLQVTRYAMCNSAMAAMAYDSNIVDDSYSTPDTDADPGTRQTFGLADKLNPVDTTIVNFSLPLDYALGQWSANNAAFKPQSFLTSSYYYHADEPPGGKLIYESLMFFRPITSVPEAMGYVTRSRSRAAGAKQSTSGSVRSSVNMGEGGFEFGTNHSAEWDLSVQNSYTFWKTLLRTFNVDIGKH